MNDRELRGPRLGWAILVGLLAVLNFWGRAVSGKPPKDVIYTWSFAVNSLVLLGVMLVVTLMLARHDLVNLLALRPPRGISLAVGLAVVVVVVVVVLEVSLEPLLHAGREQGLTTTHWRSDRAAAFAVNALLITIMSPVVEELTFRGLGYSVLVPFGRWAAILVVGATFALAHGIPQALPILFVFGASLAYVRDRTDSVYPGMVIHACFNGAGLAITLVS